MQDTLPTILVSAVGAPPGLNTLRQLATSGSYRIIATDADRLSPGLYEFQRQGVIPEVLPLAAEPTFLPALEAIITKYGVQAMLCCIENEIHAIAPVRDRLKALGCTILLPDNPVLSRGIHKGVSTLAAEQAGLPCPASIHLPAQPTQEELSAVQNFAKATPAPWICKPVHGHGMAGIETVHSVEEATAHAKAMDTEMLLQEFIPGEIGSMYVVALLYDMDNALRRSFVSRSFRTLYPTGGPATAGISVHNPELAQRTAHLLEAIGPWRGPAAVEWMLDPRDGEFKFIEINARLWGYSSLAPAAGAPFHRLAAQLALGQEIGEDPGYQEGVVMMRTFTDMIFTTPPMDGLKP